MPHIAKLKSDTPLAGQPCPAIWVLAQVSPKFEILAASVNRCRLVSEMAELYGGDNDRGLDRALRFAIRRTGVLSG